MTPDEPLRIPRNRLRVEKRVRPVRIGTVDCRLICIVRIHREENPIEEVRHVGVLPAQVRDPPVFHHRRASVALLFERELEDLLRFRNHPVEKRHLLEPRLARKPLKHCVRPVNHVFVREIARIEEIDFVQVGRKLFRRPREVFRRQVELSKSPLPVPSQRREQEPLPVEFRVKSRIVLSQGRSRALPGRRGDLLRNVLGYVRVERRGRDLVAPVLDRGNPPIPQ